MIREGDLRIKQRGQPAKHDHAASERCPCSSVWIERQPATLRVEGSSPSRGTIATTARRFASWGSQS